MLLAAAATAAEAPKPAAEPAPMKVFVSILPEAWFVERIGGAQVSVEVLVGPGQSPHTFEPTPRQMVSLGTAPLYFSIGWPFEERLLGKIKATAPNLKVVDLRKGIKMRMMTADEEAADEAAEAAEAASTQTGGPRPVVATDATEPRLSKGARRRARPAHLAQPRQRPHHGGQDHGRRPLSG